MKFKIKPLYSFIEYKKGTTSPKNITPSGGIVEFASVEEMEATGQAFKLELVSEEPKETEAGGGDEQTQQSPGLQSDSPPPETGNEANIEAGTEPDKLTSAKLKLSAVLKKG